MVSFFFFKKRVSSATVSSTTMLDATSAFVAEFCILHIGSGFYFAEFHRLCTETATFNIY